jgi:hypothetical protein
MESLIQLRSAEYQSLSKMTSKEIRKILLKSKKDWVAKGWFMGRRFEFVVQASSEHCARMDMFQMIVKHTKGDMDFGPEFGDLIM